MKKIIVSDYDQTFYLNDEDIEKNKMLVDEFVNRGNVFVIATGRSYLDFINKLNEYNFNYQYVIINHGATIFDKENNIINVNYIDDNIKDKIILDLDIKNSKNHFCCNLENSRADFDSNKLTKIHVKYDSREKAMEINELVNSKYSHYINSYYVTGNAIEIISNKANKSKAIKILKDKLNIKESDVYTIGDGYSDIEMIRDFKGFNMKDSVEELKKVSIGEYKSVSDLIGDVINEKI